MKDQNNYDEEELEAIKKEEAHQKNREAKKRQRMGISGKSVFELKRIREEKDNKNISK